MSSEQGKQIYKQRASNSETVNADCSEHRGLRRFLVRGAAKTTCVATWFALSYNIMHFASHLLGT